MAVVAQRVHEEQAVLGDGVADGRTPSGAGRAVDVRLAEALVADDGDVVARAVGAVDVVRLDPEARFGEVRADVLVLQPGRRVEQVRVQLPLVVEVRRPRPGRRNCAPAGALAVPASPGGMMWKKRPFAVPS